MKPLILGIAFFLSGCCHIQVLSGPCVGTEFAGLSDVNDANVNAPDTNDINTTTLFANILYTVPCCGVISGWNVATEGQGKVRLQVWRQVPGESNKYYYLGQNGWEKSTADVRIITRSIPAVNQIQVNTGDILAIHHLDAAIVRYSTCDPVTSAPSECSQSVYQVADSAGATLDIGYIYTFNTLQFTSLGVTTIRKYGIKASLTTKDQVACDNKTKSISDTILTGSHVTNIKADNLDTYSSGSGFSIESMEPTIDVTINSLTGEITTTGLLSPNYPSSTYVISIRVADVCSLPNTCILTLTVTNDAQPVTFENLPESIYMLQVPDLSVDVYTVQISRQREIDDVACTVQSVEPVIEEMTFVIQNKSKTEYGITMTTSPYYTETDIDIATLTVYCWNNQGFNNTSTLTLVFKPGTSTENRFWIIGLLLACIVVGTLVVVFAVLCSMYASRNDSTTPQKRRQQKRQIKPDILPTTFFVEPARTAFSNVNASSRNGIRDPGSSNTSSSGNATSPIGSTGSNITPTSISSITGIGWVEPLDTEGTRKLLSTSKNSESVFIFESPSPSKNIYFRKRPWKP